MQVNEVMILKLIKTDCLLRLLYGCEMWPTETVDMHERDVTWNNHRFRFFNCFWCDSLKPLQLFVNLCPCLFDREKTVDVFSKLQRTDNIVLRTLMCTHGKIWNAGTGSRVWTKWCEGGIVYYYGCCMVMTLFCTESSVVVFHCILVLN